jgi:excisionase family DNA binding protein
MIMTTAGKMAFSPRETALMLGLCLNTVYKLLREGKLRSVRLDRKILIPRTEIERLLSGNQPPSGSASA